MALLRQLFPHAVTMATDRECRRAGFAVLTGAGPAAGIRAGRTYSLPPRFLGMPLFRRRIVEAYHRRGARVLAFLPERLCPSTATRWKVCWSRVWTNCWSTQRPGVRSPILSITRLNLPDSYCHREHRAHREKRYGPRSSCPLWLPELDQAISQSSRWNWFSISEAGAGRAR